MAEADPQIKKQASERIRWMSKYAQRFLRSEGFTENVDCYETDFDGLLTSAMDWAGESDVTPLGAEVVRQLRAQSDEFAA